MGPWDPPKRRTGRKSWLLAHAADGIAGEDQGKILNIFTKQN